MKRSPFGIGREVLVLCVAVCLFPSGSARASEVAPLITEAPQPTRVLFVGNSFTYYNNSLHAHVRAIVSDREAHASPPTSSTQRSTASRPRARAIERGARRGTRGVRPENRVADRAGLSVALTNSGRWNWLRWHAPGSGSPLDQSRRGRFAQEEEANHVEAL